MTPPEIYSEEVLEKSRRLFAVGMEQALPTDPGNHERGDEQQSCGEPRSRHGPFVARTETPPWRNGFSVGLPRHGFASPTRENGSGPPGPKGARYGSVAYTRTPTLRRFQAYASDGKLLLAKSTR